MIVLRSPHVCLESYALHLPPDEVTSAEIEDRLAPLYERLKVPFGTLEKVSGITTRRLWKADIAPSAVGTAAGREALSQVGFDPTEIKVLVNCSVSRDYFEPATSSLVHRNLGLPEQTLSFDITNACLGVSNGIQLLSSLIEGGVVKAGILVAGENVARIIESTMRHLSTDTSLQREDLIRALPTLTLGCGAVALVLAHESLATRDHRIVGSVARSASQFNHLCMGNSDFGILQPSEITPLMHTESQGLMGEAAKLGRRMWGDFSDGIGWSREDVDHIFCHQVGRQVNEAFYAEMTLDMKKEFTTYQRYGNLVSASLPAALITGIREKGIQPGEKILCTAFGSGLNSIFLGIEW